MDAPVKAQVALRYQMVLEEVQASGLAGITTSSLCTAIFRPRNQVKQSLAMLQTDAKVVPINTGRNTIHWVVAELAEAARSKVKADIAAREVERSVSDAEVDEAPAPDDLPKRRFIKAGSVPPPKTTAARSVFEVCK